MGDDVGAFLKELDHDAVLAPSDAWRLLDLHDLTELLQAAARRRDYAHGAAISYSRKVFIPLTKLCRDVCHYCTFAQPPRKGEAAFLSHDAVLTIARPGGMPVAARPCLRSATSRSCAIAPRGKL